MLAAWPARAVSSRFDASTGIVRRVHYSVFADFVRGLCSQVRLTATPGIPSTDYRPCVSEWPV